MTICAEASSEMSVMRNGLVRELATNDIPARPPASVGTGKVPVLVAEKDSLEAYRALKGPTRAAER